MSGNTAGGIPEGFEKAGLAHQPRQLRGNPDFREGVDFVVIDGFAYTLAQKREQVENIFRQAA